MAFVETGEEAHLRLLLVEDDEGYARFVGTALDGVRSVRFQYDHVLSIAAAPWTRRHRSSM